MGRTPAGTEPVRPTSREIVGERFGSAKHPMNARIADRAAISDSFSASSGKMLRSIPTIAPTKALTTTSSENCARFSRTPGRTWFMARADLPLTAWLAALVRSRFTGEARLGWRGTLTPRWGEIAKKTPEGRRACGLVLLQIRATEPKKGAISALLDADAGVARSLPKSFDRKE